VGKRYHSGRISFGVAKGLASSVIFKGSIIPNPVIEDLILKIISSNG
jgi:hypothetical protein